MEDLSILFVEGALHPAWHDGITVYSAALLSALIKELKNTTIHVLTSIDKKQLQLALNKDIEHWFKYLEDNDVSLHVVKSLNIKYFVSAFTTIKVVLLTNSRKFLIFIINLPYLLPMFRALHLRKLHKRRIRNIFYIKPVYGRYYELYSLKVYIKTIVKEGKLVTTWPTGFTDCYMPLPLDSLFNNVYGAHKLENNYSLSDDKLRILIVDARQDRYDLELLAHTFRLLSKYNDKLEIFVITRPWTESITNARVLKDFLTKLGYNVHVLNSVMSVYEKIKLWSQCHVLISPRSNKHTVEPPISTLEAIYLGLITFIPHSSSLRNLLPYNTFKNSYDLSKKLLHIIEYTANSKQLAISARNKVLKVFNSSYIRQQLQKVLKSH